MISSKSSKSSKMFTCNNCDYNTCRKSQYDRHLLTLKHEMITNGNKMVTKSSYQVPLVFECNCGKQYTYASGLSRHKKRCPEQNIKSNDMSGNLVNVEIVMELLKQNNEFKGLLTDQNKNMITLMEKGIGNTTNTNTNSHNTTNKNKFNLNIFLNEQCKDAMNIMDFVDSLKLQLTDLETVGELGYTKGISNIIVSALQKIDVFKRPIHCSDIKRETMYVKDENAWEKEDTNKEKMTKMIKQVAYKNVKQIPEWQGENPEYKDNESTVHDQYLKIVNESMGGCNEEEDSKNYNKIVKTIAKEVIIERESESVE